MQIQDFITLMQYMAGGDTDRAKQRNQVGFNTADTNAIVGILAHAMLLNPVWFENLTPDEQTMLMQACAPELEKYKTTQLAHLWDASWVLDYPAVPPRYIGALADEAREYRDNLIVIKPQDGKISIKVEKNYKVINPCIKGKNDEYKIKYSLWFDYDGTKAWVVKDTSYTVEQIVEYLREATADLKVSIRVEDFNFEAKPIEKYILIYAYKGMYGVKFIEFTSAMFMPLKDGLKELAVQYGSMCRWNGEPDLTWQISDKRVIDEFVKGVQEHYGHEIRFEEVDSTPLEELQKLGKDEDNQRRYTILEKAIEESKVNGIQLLPFQINAAQHILTDTLINGTKTGDIIAAGTGTGKTVISSLGARVLLEDKEADFVMVVTTLINKNKVDTWLQKFNVNNRIVANWSSTMPYVEVECQVHEPRKTSNIRLAWVNPHTNKDSEGWIADSDAVYGAKKHRLIIPVTKSGTSVLHLNRDMLAKFQQTKVKGKDVLILEEPKFVLILDEAHRSANAFGANRSAIGTAANWLSRASAFNIGTTATPFRNGCGTDIYALLWRTGLPLPRKADFCNRYSIPQYFYGKISGYKGIRNHKELFDLCRPVLYQVSTTQALEGLPPISVKRTDIDDTDDDIVPLIREWRSQAAKFASEYTNKGRIPIEEMNALRRSASVVKVKQTVNAAIEIIQSSEKLVVYSPYKTTLDIIYKQLETQLEYIDSNTFEPCVAKLYQIDGSTSEKTRQAYAKEFQGLIGAAIILITDAGSESVDLNSSRLLICHDLNWTVSSFQQVSGRVIRYGSEVHDHILIMVMTIPEIDDMIWDNVSSKLGNVYTFEAEGEYRGHGIDTASMKLGELGSVVKQILSEENELADMAQKEIELETIS